MNIARASVIGLAVTASLAAALPGSIASAQDALRALQDAPGIPTAPAAPSAAPSAPAQGSIGGEWSGKYFCAQGVTGAQLIFSGDGSRALFHFYAVPENPGVPEGCFTMAGVFNQASSTLDLTASQWLVRPRNYRTANVSGLVDAGRQNFLGRLTGPAGCTVIALTREPSPRPLPNACERGLP